MTSHAALVARGWGKCCVVGCSAIEVDYGKKELHIAGKVLKEGDWITLNGTKGAVYEGKLPMLDATRRKRPAQQLPEDLRQHQETRHPHKRRYAGRRTEGKTTRRRRHRAIQDGAYVLRQGFSDEPLFILRKMIVSKD